MYELVDHIENLTFFADRMSKQNKDPDPTLVISESSLSVTRWMNREELTALFFEEIKDKQVKRSHYYQYSRKILQGHNFTVLY